MEIILAHKIALNPTPSQEQLLAKAVGVRRFAWNWALAEWKRQYEAGEKPHWMKLSKQLNAIKHEQFPWMADVSACATQNAIRQLGDAFQRFFKKTSKYPNFKKRRNNESARLDNGTPGQFECRDKSIRLQKIGWVKMRESLRFSGKPMSVTVSRVAGRWFASVTVKMEHTLPERKPNSVGIDLGVTTAATLSTGEKFEGPKPLKTEMGKLRRMSKHLSRKQPGSNNWRKASLKLGRMHARIANIRKDWTHKFTTSVVRRFGTIGIEDLAVSEMMSNQRLARSISDVGFYEIRRQLTYKAQLNNRDLVVASRWFPSSKTCSECGHVVDKLPLSYREWTCQCGAHHDRDVNAARNLQGVALAAPSHGVDHACGVVGADALCA